MDGSAYPLFYLTEKETEDIYDKDGEGFSECCNGKVETFENSNVHLEAIKNSAERLEFEEKEGE